MNKFQRFIGRISTETSLKIDYFDSKSPKIAKRWELRSHTPLPPAAGGFVKTFFEQAEGRKYKM